MISKVISHVYNINSAARRGTNIYCSKRRRSQTCITVLPFEQKPVIKENQLYVNIHCIKIMKVNKVLKYYN